MVLLNKVASLKNVPNIMSHYISEGREIIEMPLSPKQYNSTAPQNDCSVESTRL